MQPAWLARALEQGPAVHGWTEDQRWTLARVSVLIARRFHVRFSQPQLSRILPHLLLVPSRSRCTGTWTGRGAGADDAR
jgi:hypothetical protein